MIDGFARLRTAAVASAVILVLYGGLIALLVSWVSTMSAEFPSDCGDRTMYDFCLSDRENGKLGLAIAGVFLGPVSLVTTVAIVLVQVVRLRRPEWWLGAWYGMLAALGGLLGSLGLAVQLTCLFRVGVWFTGGR